MNFSKHIHYSIETNIQSSKNTHTKKKLKTKSKIEKKINGKKSEQQEQRSIFRKNNRGDSFLHHLPSQSTFSLSPHIK